MSDANNEQLRPPPSWDKFEEICADLFSRVWNDSQLVRYGRQGQRQLGVDIYGRENGTDSGVQCKGKRNWPPTKLTTAEIDVEIEEAKKFRPLLKNYVIATTAENDVHVTDHVNAISAEHAKRDLFRVTVFGWSELVRRFYDHPELLEKHFGIFTLRNMQHRMPDAVAERVVERLQSANAAIGLNDAERAPHARPGLLDDRLADALERDFGSRYERALRRSIFPELNKMDEFAPLATEVLGSAGSALSTDLRRSIFSGPRVPPQSTASLTTHGDFFPPVRPFTVRLQMSRDVRGLPSPRDAPAMPSRYCAMPLTTRPALFF